MKASLPAIILAAFATLAVSLPADEDTPKPSSSRPDFQRLLKLNEAQIFGGKVKLLGDDAIQISYNADGEFARGFEGEGIFDHTNIIGSDKKFVYKKVEKDGSTSDPYPGLACMGKSKPSGKWTFWTSRFSLTGDVEVMFNLRLPALINFQSGFVGRLNVQDKACLETSFFSTAQFRSSRGIKARAVSRDGKKAMHAMNWFPRNREEGVPVELAVAGGKFAVNVDKEEIVSLNKYPKLEGGKIAFGFRKIVICLHYLKISGKLDRKWCENELKTLEKSGMLITGEPGKQPAPGSEAEKKKKKEAEEDL